mmetsp:Transcript_27507/g.64152  ORF Transcript_27507/g.64152 Transcript_27507/m.64152 type:complete len:195 (-) Transcript_27507:213-797(-)|eukprot:CAMPEP_0178423290 /NCGR_PEP_ID=MMETSP0689_2-20121128/27611_1 /TAXON_ID=160604 /ORGANISM="Amphidinium massartii, Strain CS-259" /LENGTH=194 /DNA_ID=CAMNT_0020044877 /DNA_START=81 /DNA_END=665 /DNA_ORIENTATION=-
MGSPAAGDSGTAVEADDIEIKCANVPRPKALQERIDMRRKKRENAKRGPIRMDLGNDLDDDDDDSGDAVTLASAEPAGKAAAAAVAAVASPKVARKASDAEAATTVADCTLSGVDAATAARTRSNGAASTPAATCLDLVDETMPTVTRKRSSEAAAKDVVEVLDGPADAEKPPAKVARTSSQPDARKASVVVLE